MLLTIDNPTHPTTTKVICQPKVVPSHAINNGAITAPAAAPLLKIPDAVKRSSGGNHSLVNFIADGQFPASPIPEEIEIFQTEMPT